MLAAESSLAALSATRISMRSWMCLSKPLSHAGVPRPPGGNPDFCVRKILKTRLVAETMSLPVPPAPRVCPKKPRRTLSCWSEAQYLTSSLVWRSSRMRTMVVHFRRNALSFSRKASTMAQRMFLLLREHLAPDWRLAEARSPSPSSIRRRSWRKESIVGAPLRQPPFGPTETPNRCKTA